MSFLNDSKAAHLFFDRLMESLPDHVYFKDLEGRFLCVSQAQAKYLGLESSEEAIGKNDYDFFEASQARQKDADEREIIRTGKGFVEKEELASGLDGGERWVLTTKLPLLGDGGEIIGTYGISRNISEMKAAREAVNAQNRLLATLIEILPCRVFIKDRDGRIKLTNQAYRAALGISDKDRIEGRRLGEIVNDSRTHNYAADDRAVLEKGLSILNREDYDASPIGDKRWLLISKVPLRDASDEIEGIVGMAADITTQKEAEARAVEAQHALEEKNRQIEGELELARDLQTELMSSSMRSVCAELDTSAAFVPEVAFLYQPSAHLAGDFFQFLPISEDSFAFIMCDVMGHGVKAALVTTLIRGLVANVRAEEQSPSEVMQALNERLCALLDRPPLPRFVTAIYAFVDIRRGRVRLASAGHPWPLRRRADGKTAPMRGVECGPALGLIRGTGYETFGFDVEKQDSLLFFTDGWTEEVNAVGEEYGVDALAAALSGATQREPNALLEELMSAMRRHASTQALSDDVCAMLMCF